MLIQRTFGILFSASLTLSAMAQTVSQKSAVPLTATVQSSPARITLAWTTLPSTTSITIYRKLVSATSWGSSIASPSASSLTYADNTVSVGTSYEYKVVRVAAGVTSTGFINTGIALPPVDYRGRMILLVDNTFSSALSTELTTLQSDLRMDGWSVVRVNLARTSSVATVKSTIVTQYNADPTNTKAVYIIGHLAVPYSGNVNPDGHTTHRGAWPCDGYYGDVNGTWTDNTVNNTTSSRVENRNTPGDGKFDQSDFPSTVELQVGRVDFYDLPAFSSNETELMRSYLNKAHAFKKKQFTPNARGIIFDNLQWSGDPLAGSAWRNVTPMVGSTNITASNPNSTPLYQLVNSQSYLWTYGSGGGTIGSSGGISTFNGAEHIATTENLATTAFGGVFNFSFGSYYGDWDNRNNYLRALLGSGNALTHCWVGMPAWYFHHMGMGGNIGQSTQTSMNNSSLYTPQAEGYSSSVGRVAMGLMGDPSLRQKMLAAPSNLQITNSGGHPAFTWSASSETVDGYHVYSINGSTGVITRLTTSIVTGTSYTSTASYVAGTEYMVRATRLITEPSGSYYNLSLGVSAIASGSAPAPPPCTATITAGSSTSFCSGGSVVLSAPTASGNSYQWKKNGANVSGATSATYTASASGSYTVTVTNGSCSNTSAATTVTVNSAPVISCASTPGGASASLSVTVSSGTGPYSYSWNTSPVQTSASASVSTSGSYTVTVTSANGCASSCTTNAVVSGGSSCSGFFLAAQGTWGASATSSNLSGEMVSAFATAFPSPNYLTIGCGTRKVRFTTGNAVIAALPAYGTPAVLASGTLTNPASLLNTLAGQLVTAKLNARFDELDPSFAPYAGPIKSLVITTGTFAGMTFQQLIDLADQAVGGCSSTYSLSTISDALTTINNGYDMPGENVGYLTCSGSSAIALQDPTGTDALAAPFMDVLIYPVPVSGTATIQLGGLAQNAEVTIDVLSITGASVGVLFKGEMEAGVPRNVEWNAADLAPGIYLCRVSAGDQVASYRVVVE